MTRFSSGSCTTTGSRSLRCCAEGDPPGPGPPVSRPAADRQRVNGSWEACNPMPLAREGDQEEVMLLEGKTAVVYGAGGAIGSAVAIAFAREGARLFLAGRTMQSLDDVAARIRRTGGTAEVAQVDVLNRKVTQAHAAALAEAK